MRITRLSLYRVYLDRWQVSTRYQPTDGLDVSLQTNVVRLDSDAGLTGWGEGFVPPPFYHPTLAPAARQAIEYAAPLVVGADPRQPRRIMEAIRRGMRGQQPAKSAIDMALWDLCGKAHGLPLVDLWGGRVVEALPVLTLISVGPVEAMLGELEEQRAVGYDLFQIKIGIGTADEEVERITRIGAAMGPGERCWFDVNRGWTVDQAMQVLPRVAHLAPLIEQPCETYQECKTLAERTGLAFMLDEVIDGQEALVRAVLDGVMSSAVLKLSCTGGISQHRHLAELGLRLGVPLRIEDYYGTGLTFAAVAHLAHGLPAAATFGLYDYQHPDVPLVRNPLEVREGRVSLPADCGPGLGVDVNEEILGEPLAVIEG